MKREKNAGSITLEACIALTLFIFFVISIYSFFMVFEVQGKVSTALLQSSQSLSLDSFGLDKTNVDFSEEDSDLSFFKLIIDKIGMQKMIKDDKYVTRNKQWYKKDLKASECPDLLNAIKNRFIAHLTDEGTVDAARSLLKTFKVEDDIDGLDFSESELKGNKLTVRVKYKVKYIFDCPTVNLEPMEFSQSTTVNLWRAKSANYDPEEASVSSQEGSSKSGHSSGNGKHG